MQRRAERADPVAEAEKRGMAISESYTIPGRGEIRVATAEQFGSYEEFARYVHKNRHDPDKVMFINPKAGHVYASGKEQDIIAWEIAREEGVSTGSAPPASFLEEKEGAERGAEARPRREKPETEVFFIRYAGSPVRIEMDVRGMGGRQVDELREEIEKLRHRPRGEAFAQLENDFSKFLDRYLSDITNITVEAGGRRVSVRLDEATLSEINGLAGRS